MRSYTGNRAQHELPLQVAPRYREASSVFKKFILDEFKVAPYNRLAPLASRAITKTALKCFTQAKATMGKMPLECCTLPSRESSLCSMKLFNFDAQEPWHRGGDGQGSQDTGNTAADDGELGGKESCDET